MGILSKLFIFKKLVRWFVKFIKWIFKINFKIIRFVLGRISNYTGGGVIFGLISVFLLLLSFVQLSQFSESMLIRDIVSSVPLFMLTGYFSLKLAGFYEWGLIEDKRRDVKKALILVVALQTLMIAPYSAFVAFICFISIPLAILEWFPHKTYNYLKENVNNVSGLKTFLES